MRQTTRVPQLSGARVQEIVCTEASKQLATRCQRKYCQSVSGWSRLASVNEPSSKDRNVRSIHKVIVSPTCARKDGQGAVVCNDTHGSTVRVNSQNRHQRSCLDGRSTCNGSRIHRKCHLGPRHHKWRRHATLHHHCSHPSTSPQERRAQDLKH